jgi:hypothetical protein
MKNILIGAVLLFSLGFMLFGCGSQNSTTTTTTTTTLPIAAVEVSTAKTGVLLAGGGSTAGSSASGVSSATGSTVTFSVKAQEAGPPDTFFTYDLSTSTDGWLSPVTREAMGGNMRPYMRLRTVGGDIIANAFLTGKKIADLSPCTVELMMNGTPGTPPVGINTGITSFVTKFVADPADPSLYINVRYMADYIAWAFMYPSMESGMASHGHPLPAGAHLTTPEAGANDKIGTMDMRMVFSSFATGEVIISVPTEPGGRPNSGTYSGFGTLEASGVRLNSTVTMQFGASGPPSGVTITGTDEITGNTVVVSFYPATMTGSGTLYNSTGTLIGTFEGSSSGGIYYKAGGSAEAFTF